VATLKFRDWADEFRIEIIGRLAGKCTLEVANEWQRAVNEATSRRVVVDITRLSGYDVTGRQLLAHIYNHGTTIAAGTPLSLVFLHEITHTPKVVGRELVIEPTPGKKSLDSATARFRAQAAGE
jgi:ABC-type transporter Mla MlaB component